MDQVAPAPPGKGAPGTASLLLQQAVMPMAGIMRSLGPGAEGLTAAGAAEALLTAGPNRTDAAAPRRLLATIVDSVHAAVMIYLGSKAASGAYQAIIAVMPPHDTYVELFAGSGAVLLHKPAAVRSYAVDLDPRPLASICTARPDVDCRAVDAFDFLDGFDYAGAGRTLIYADLPYLHSTRTSSKRYKHELTDEDHRALLLRLLLAPASVIVSGYPSSLYARLLSSWATIEFQAMARGGPRTEKLWCNFPLAGAVHWSTFAGSGFTDRQRIKRKAARWAENYRALPPGERLAVLSAFLALDANPLATPPSA